MLASFTGVKMKEIENLKKIMKNLGFSQEKVARELGVSSKTVSRWLKGESEPSELAKYQIKKFIKKHSRKSFTS